MPWPSTFDITAWARGMNDVFRATYGRDLVIDEAELRRFVSNTRFKDIQHFLAYMRRVVAYYNQKYQYIPRMSHLLSAQLPRTGPDDWEAALYKEVPDFHPSYFTQENVLEVNRKVRGMTMGEPQAALFHRFAVAVVGHPNPAYVPRAHALLEKLVFTLGRDARLKRKYSLQVAVQAHERLRALGKAHRTLDHKIWGKKHWSAALVRAQYLTVFGLQFTFWELAKIMVSASFAEQVLNCTFTPAHNNALRAVIASYAWKHGPYVQFCLNVRPEYILRSYDEIEQWSRLSLCEYAYPF